MNPRRQCSKNDSLCLGAERNMKASAIVNNAQIANAVSAGNYALLDSDLSQVQGQLHGVALPLHPFGWRIGWEILQIKPEPALQVASTNNGKLMQAHAG
jgi:hypothetical protein